MPDKTLVSFKKGLLANLPATKTAGTIYITTDERALYMDVDASTRIRMGDFQSFANTTALAANTNPSMTALYYVEDLNCLAKWDGTKYVQINRDTGMTSVEVTGEGNVITGASYSAATRTLTLTRGTVEQITVPEYTIAKLATAEAGYAASYQLTKDGTQVGATINIPKDMVVQSGTVETKTASGAWGNAGTYLHLVLANATNSDIYINVADLIEYVTSGSAAGDMVFVSIDANHQVTATITDGTITLAKLATAVQTKINQAHEHSNKTVLDGITATQVSNWDNEVGAKAGLALKAPLASPDLTGTPTAPTATAGTNTTQIATTAFVTTAVSNAELAWIDF